LKTALTNIGVGAVRTVRDGTDALSMLSEPF